MITPKEHVIRSFLDLVFLHVPASQAILATLGGQGFEAKIWVELGVPPDNGWLIELNRERGGNLIKNHRYHTHNRLGTFHKILGGYGDGSRIDGFHLDLCGTARSKVMSDFSSIMPYLLKSTAKCLAITVADQRGNTVFDRWQEFEQRGKALFGDESARVFETIISQQRLIPVRTDLPKFMVPFDPHKAAKREFGILVEIAEMLKAHRMWIPTSIVRYVYVSRFEKRPFRMRTYFFHFEVSPVEVGARTIARLWTESPLHYGNNGEAFLHILLPAAHVAGLSETEGSSTMTSRLGELARVLGGAELAEYETLSNAHKQLQQITRAVASVNGHANTAPTSAPNSNVRSADSAPSSTPRRTWKGLSDEEQIEWLLKVHEMKKNANGTWETTHWKRLLKDDFGHYSKSLGKSLRSAMAHMNGGFRPAFAKRIKKVFGAKAQPYLERLAKV